MMLCILNALLKYRSRILDQCHQAYSLLLEELIHSNPIALHFKLFSQIAGLYEGLEYSSTHLATATELLLGVVLPGLEGAKTTSFTVELRALCTDVSNMANSISKRLDQRFRLLELQRQTHEATSLRRISLWAGIFLPLSLASSLLSMQTRAMDLHWLVFDWVGLAAVIATFSAGLICVPRIGSRLSIALQSFPIWMQARNMAQIVTYIIGVIVAILVLSSFLVGMTTDTDLGLRMLGYGFAAILGLILVVAILVLCARAAVRWADSIWDKRRAKQRVNRADQEALSRCGPPIPGC
jgi:hypothetical protein